MHLLCQSKRIWQGYMTRSQIGYTNTLASLASDRREQNEYLEELYKFERTPWEQPSGARRGDSRSLQFTISEDTIGQRLGDVTFWAPLDGLEIEEGLARFKVHCSPFRKANICMPYGIKISTEDRGTMEVLQSPDSGLNLHGVTSCAIFNNLLGVSGCQCPHW